MIRGGIPIIAEIETNGRASLDFLIAFGNITVAADTL
jgi:hypothetical protein